MRTEHHHWHSPRLGHEMGVGGLRALGSAAARVSDQPRRRVGARAPRLIGAIGRVHRRRPRQGLLRRLEQPRVVPEQAGASVPSQLAAAAVRRLHPRRSGPVHPLALPDSGDSASRRWARRSARITPPTRCSATRTWSSAATRCRASTTCAGSWTACYDDNFYFHNPVDYLANLSDPWILEQLASCDIRLAPDGPVGRQRLTPTSCRASSRAKASATISTTGARAAATTGRTGRIRSGVSAGW